MPEKVNQKAIQLALAQLGMLEFFPPDPATRAAIGILLAKMCPHRGALDWLVAEMVNHIGKWHGPTELRGLLCTHYKPSDDVEETCSLPGYTPRDAEEKHLDTHRQLKAGGWTEDAGRRQLTESSLKLIEGMKKEWPQ